ncbi:MAG: SCP2 sterol-binding domain-containing protein [Butyrivibrio sp.]
MKINIYYGGRGMIDDPTIAVINRMTSVLEELRVNVERFNLYEIKNAIMTLPQTLKDADAVILASTVEWFGIGGYMHTFLDACWLYGDKSRISGTYMFPIVMSRAYGEKEAVLELTNAWEMLGGKSCNGLCAYVEDSTDFELNANYMELVEKKAEEVYRAVSQKYITLPTSNKAIKQNIVGDTINLTPQESEQLSKYASNDNYVKKQKEDIEQLAGMFKTMLEEEEKGGDEHYINMLKEHYVPQDNFSATYLLKIENREDSLIIVIKNKSLNCYFGQIESADVIGKLGIEVLDNIMEGRMTFQRAFMSGEMTAKGNFKTLRMLDENFVFV